MLSHTHYVVADGMLPFQDSGLIAGKAVDFFLFVKVKVLKLSFNAMRGITAFARAAPFFDYSPVEACMLDPNHITQLEMLAAA